MRVGWEEECGCVIVGWGRMWVCESGMGGGVWVCEGGQGDGCVDGVCEDRPKEKRRVCAKMVSVSV